ncbi:hypothetical protein [Burkholderia plantarii]|nr:hypothetical protein [Burkholderia plantarii]ALK35207.1 hypothetical protein bpln_1p0610 [Burkholderia plantarii]WLE64253.1 hypothetical protein GIY62_35515 [Burkholderia plantarii]
MNLTVSAYALLEIAESPLLDAHGEPLEPHTVKLMPSPRFPERAPEIESGRIYRHQIAFDFNAGTYLMHCLFIEQLAELADYAPTVIGRSQMSHANGAIVAKEGPFKELIDFSIVSGTLGTFVCAKLAEDFERFMRIVDADAAPMLAETYRNWYFALTLASNRGAVQLS